MEDFERLYYHPDTGYIIRYKESGIILMAYSILKIGFYPDEFYRFRKYLSWLMDQRASSSVDATLKTISIRTPDPAMEIILSLRELKQLYEIVETADSEMKALDMVNIINRIT